MYDKANLFGLKGLAKQLLFNLESAMVAMEPEEFDDLMKGEIEAFIRLKGDAKEALLEKALVIKQMELSAMKLRCQADVFKTEAAKYAGKADVRDRVIDKIKGFMHELMVTCDIPKIKNELATVYLQKKPDTYSYDKHNDELCRSLCKQGLGEVKTMYRVHSQKIKEFEKKTGKLPVGVSKIEGKQGLRIR